MSGPFHRCWISRRAGRAGGFLLIAALSAAALPARAQNLPLDVQPTCVVTQAQFAGWFQSGSIALNGLVNPANSVTFSHANNCVFYQWSEQMFLWLTSPVAPNYNGAAAPVNGATTPVFNAQPFYDVSPLGPDGKRHFIPHTPGFVRPFAVRAAQVGSHGLPVIMSKSGRLLEIQPPQLGPTGKPAIRSRAGRLTEIQRVQIGNNGKAVFFDPAGKPIPLTPSSAAARLSKTPLTVQRFIIGGKPVFIDPVSGDVIEIGPSQADHGVLLAQNGSLIYYAAMVNDVYAYFLTGAKDGAITPTPTRFPTTQAELDQIVAFAKAHNVTFPDPDALAIEVKTSWIEAATLPNPGDYITMMGDITAYDTSNPNQWPPLPNQKTVLLALVGIHVVGSMAGHPEMTWATFEHLGNTPNATYQYNSVNGPNPVTVPQSTAGTWLFSANGSPGPYNAMHMHFQPPSPNIFSIPPNNISPSDTLRMKVWGAASDQTPNPEDATPAASNTEIISINDSVRGLMASGGAGADLRNNYIMSGATWTNGGAPPTGSYPNGNEIGTSILTNTTMETYQQGSGTTFATGGTNCFGCHRVNQNLTDVSHFYSTLQPLF